MLHFLPSPEEPLLLIFVYYFRIYLMSIIIMLLMLLLDFSVSGFIYQSTTTEDKYLAIPSLHALLSMPPNLDCMIK